MPPPQSVECWKLLVRGRVQGVGYRASARHEARRLGLKGLARNLPDGSVEVIAAGAPATLTAFEAWCRRGPMFANVTSVDVEHLADVPNFAAFDIG